MPSTDTRTALALHDDGTTVDLPRLGPHRVRRIRAKNGEGGNQIHGPYLSGLIPDSLLPLLTEWSKEANHG